MVLQAKPQQPRSRCQKNGENYRNASVTHPDVIREHFPSKKTWARARKGAPRCGRHCRLYPAKRFVPSALVKRAHGRGKITSERKQSFNRAATLPTRFQLQLQQLQLTTDFRRCCRFELNLGGCDFNLQLCPGGRKTGGGVCIYVKHYVDHIYNAFPNILASDECIEIQNMLICKPNMKKIILIKHSLIFLRMN